MQARHHHAVNSAEAGRTPMVGLQTGRTRDVGPSCRAGSGFVMAAAVAPGVVGQDPLHGHAVLDAEAGGSAVQEHRPRRSPAVAEGFGRARSRSSTATRTTSQPNLARWSECCGHGLASRGVRDATRFPHVDGRQPAGSVRSGGRPYRGGGAQGRQAGRPWLGAAAASGAVAAAMSDTAAPFVGPSRQLTAMLSSWTAAGARTPWPADAAAHPRAGGVVRRGDAPGATLRRREAEAVEDEH